jgi:hypothetical protein
MRREGKGFPQGRIGDFVVGEDEYIEDFFREIP